MLRFMDGFKHYPTSDVTKKWTSHDSARLHATGGPSGGGYLDFGVVIHSLLKSIDAQPLWVQGVRLMWGGTSALNLLVTKYGTVEQVTMAVNAEGYLVLSNNAGHEFGRTTAPVLTANVWRYVEMRVLHDVTAGTIDVRVDGDDVLNLTGVNTDSAGSGHASTVGIMRTFSAGLTDLAITDYYACDGQGGTNNDFLGDVEVQTLYPTGVGTVTDWAPLSGDNWSNVDEAQADGDTSFVYANVVGKADLYEYSGITELSGVIHGIQHNVWARKVTSGLVKIAPVTRADSSSIVGSSASLSSTYSDAIFIEETNPETGLAWLISEVNAAEFGQVIVAP